MSQGTFSDTLIRLAAFKRIFLFRRKIDFYPRGKSTVFLRNDQISKSAFCTCLFPKGSRRVVKLSWEQKNVPGDVF